MKKLSFYYYNYIYIFKKYNYYYLFLVITNEYVAKIRNMTRENRLE